MLFVNPIKDVCTYPLRSLARFSPILYVGDPLIALSIPAVLIEKMSAAVMDGSTVQIGG